MFEIVGEDAVYAGNLTQQDIAELDLRSEHSWRGACPGQELKLDVSLLDRAERILDGAIKGLIQIADFSHYLPQWLQRNDASETRAIFILLIRG